MAKFFNNYIFSEYIINNQPLGGLLLLLPQKVSNKIVGEIKRKDDGLMRNIVVELEQLLIRANIPVSDITLYLDPIMITWSPLNYIITI